MGKCVGVRIVHVRCLYVSVLLWWYVYVGVRMRECICGSMYVWGYVCVGEYVEACVAVHAV